MLPEFVTILGVRFFNGSVEDAVERMEHGGLLVVPAAPALKDIDRNVGYREALLNADLCITDSAFMVLIWNRISKQKIHRLSGLKYLRELLRREDAHRPGNVVWIMASPASAEKNLAWLRKQGIEVPQECVYLAPMYGEEIEDRALLELLERVKPQHVMVTVGRRNAGAAGAVSEAAAVVRCVDSLHRRGDCISERRPGGDSGVGGSLLRGVAVSDGRRPEDGSVRVTGRLASC